MKLLRQSATIASLVTAATLASNSAHAQGVRYTLASSAEDIWWDSSLGFEDRLRSWTVASSDARTQ